MEPPDAPLHGAPHHLRRLRVLPRVKKTHRNSQERLMPRTQRNLARLEPIQRSRWNVEAGRNRRGVLSVLLYRDVRGGA